MLDAIQLQLNRLCIMNNHAACDTFVFRQRRLPSANEQSFIPMPTCVVCCTSYVVSRCYLYVCWFWVWIFVVCVWCLCQFLWTVMKMLWTVYTKISDGTLWGSGTPCVCVYGDQESQLTLTLLNHAVVTDRVMTSFRQTCNLQCSYKCVCIYCIYNFCSVLYFPAWTNQPSTLQPNSANVLLSTVKQ